MSATAQTTLARLHTERLVAVIRAGGAQQAIRAGRALAAGGVRALEVAFTTPDAASAIAELSGFEDLFVGAGTVLSADQAQAAVEAGAQFLISPALVEDVLEVGEETGVLTIPAALTPTEVVAASTRAEAVKLFPASLGGPAYLKALRGPLPDVKLIPTGGVDAGNVGEWLAAGAYALGAGGDLCPPARLAVGDFEALTERARHYRVAVDAVEAR